MPRYLFLAPSKECGRFLLTKFPLAQFTARLFWRFGDERRHLAFDVFDALPTHSVAGRHTRPIHTPHRALPLKHARVIQQSRSFSKMTGHVYQGRMYGPSVQARVYLAKTIAFWRRQCGHQQTLEITLGFEFEQLVVQLVQQLSR
jgi:hypothetical protein